MDDPVQSAIFTARIARAMLLGKYARFAVSFSPSELRSCIAAASRFHAAFVSEPVVTRASFSEALYGAAPLVPTESDFPPITFSAYQGSIARVQQGLQEVYASVQSRRRPERPLEGLRLSVPSDGLDEDRPAFLDEFRRSLEGDPEVAWASGLSEVGAYHLLWGLGEVEARTLRLGRAEPYPGASSTSPRDDILQILAAADALVLAVHRSGAL